MSMLVASQSMGSRLIAAFQFAFGEDDAYLGLEVPGQPDRGGDLSCGSWSGSHKGEDDRTSNL